MLLVMDQDNERFEPDSEDRVSRLTRERDEARHDAHIAGIYKTGFYRCADNASRLKDERDEARKAAARFYLQLQKANATIEKLIPYEVLAKIRAGEFEEEIFDEHFQEAMELKKILP